MQILVRDKSLFLLQFKKTEQGEKLLQWQSLNGQEKELELYLFENDAKFEKVLNTNGGRIYYLHFESFEDKYFFWLQDPDSTKDEQIANEVQQLIDLDYQEICQEQEFQTPQKQNNDQTLQQNTQQLQQSQMIQQINQGLNLGALTGLMSERKCILKRALTIINTQAISKKQINQQTSRKTNVSFALKLTELRKSQ